MIYVRGERDARPHSLLIVAMIVIACILAICHCEKLPDKHEHGWQADQHNHMFWCCDSCNEKCDPCVAMLWPLRVNPVGGWRNWGQLEWHWPGGSDKSVIERAREKKHAPRYGAGLSSSGACVRLTLTGSDRCYETLRVFFSIYRTGIILNSS